MKILIRRTLSEDLNNIYDLHEKCFIKTDLWYKNNIQNYLNDGIVIVIKDTNEIIGVLLQGYITPCNKKNDILSLFGLTSDYQEDIFKPLTENGILFNKNNKQYNEIYGIVMICIHPKYQKKGLGKILISRHFNDNPNKLLCLNTRSSNENAIKLYIKMGYENIGLILNKYFLPNENSVFMIKNN